MRGEILAWQQQPEPNGTLYYAPDLAAPDAVCRLFECCKQQQGYITPDGWEFLFNTFGAQKLSELNQKCGWFEEADGEAPLPNLVYQSLLAGYNPINKQTGDYDTETFEFLAHSGEVTKIDWSKLEV